MSEIKIECPAKINLTLKITGKRPDGFHELESVMQTISLCDYLTIKLEKSDSLEIKLSGSSTEIPYDETNLVYKAAKLFFEGIADSAYKINIYIKKNIPVAAGLAGGSTNAAGTLYGLNELLNRPYTRTRLHELCARLGSDLNLCLEGGRQMTKGRGEILEPLEFEEFELSLIKPLNLGISAKEAYTKFSQKMADSPSGRENYVNDLEWAVIDSYPELRYIKQKYPLSVMSGSGSTYYVINETIKPEKGFWIQNNIKSVPYGVRVI